MEIERGGTIHFRNGDFWSDNFWALTKTESSVSQSAARQAHTQRNWLLLLAGEIDLSAGDEHRPFPLPIQTDDDNE